MSIFEKLIKERESRKVTQRLMAKHLKITPSTLNRYEQGNRKIGLEMAENYADFLGLEFKLMVK